MSSLSILFSLFLISLSLLTHPTFSKPTRKSFKFSTNTNTTFENCNDLPTLDAVLHWTYNPSHSSLSMAFTAAPSEPQGWVAWALNPTDTGMAGAQTLLAHKPNSSGPIPVDTYDIRSYHDITKGPISYNVTSISAVESSGAITIFATWALRKGETSTVINHVWQVGPMKDGKIGKHAFEPSNLGSKMKLSLTAPTLTSVSASMASTLGSSIGAGVRLVSRILTLGAVVVCFHGC